MKKLFTLFLISIPFLAFAITDSEMSNKIDAYINSKEVNEILDNLLNKNKNFTETDKQLLKPTMKEILNLQLKLDKIKSIDKKETQKKISELSDILLQKSDKSKPFTEREKKDIMIMSKKIDVSQKRIENLSRIAKNDGVELSELFLAMNTFIDELGNGDAKFRGKDVLSKFIDAINTIRFLKNPAEKNYYQRGLFGYADIDYLIYSAGGLYDFLIDFDNDTLNIIKKKFKKNKDY